MFSSSPPSSGPESLPWLVFEGCRVERAGVVGSNPTTVGIGYGCFGLGPQVSRPHSSLGKTTFHGNQRNMHLSDLCNSKGTGEG